MKYHIMYINLSLFICLSFLGLLSPIRAQGPAPFAWDNLTVDDLPGVYSYHNWRITQLRVEDPNIPTYSVTAVANAGDWAVDGWWWFAGYEGNDLDSLTSTNAARLISIEPHYVGDALRFSGIMVANSGKNARGWWWYYGVDEAAVRTYATQNNAILVSARPYNDNGNLRYVVIMVENKENLKWFWCVKATNDAIVDTWKANSLRIATFMRNPFGQYDAILVGWTGGVWYWQDGINFLTARDNFIKHNTRPVDISTYVVNGVRYYAMVEQDNNIGPWASEV